MRIGITSIVPIEIVYAAGMTPVSLVKKALAFPQKEKLIEEAEADGLPRITSSWAKLIYALTLKEGLDKIIALAQGDSREILTVCEALRLRGVKVLFFSYPYDRDEKLLKREMATLAQGLGGELSVAENIAREFDDIREKVARIDRMCWQKGTVNGEENYHFLLKAWDMDENPTGFAKQVDAFLQAIEQREVTHFQPRLGLIGGPLMIEDLYQYVEDLQARIVYNEIAQQWALLDLNGGLIEKYLRCSYLYGMKARIPEIEKEIKRRRIDGLIHYTQSFTHHQIEDLILRKRVKIPVLTLEADRPGPMDERSRIRLTAFVQMLGKAHGKNRYNLHCADRSNLCRR